MPALRRRKLPLPFVLAYLLLVLVVGGSCIYDSFTSPGSLGLFPLGVLMIVFALTLAPLHVLRRRLPRGIPAPRTATAPNGEQGLMLPRWPLPWYGTGSLTAALVFMFGFWAVEAALQQPPAWALVVVLGLVGLWMACLLVFVLTGRMRAGGLYLTEHELIHHVGSAVSSIPWDDISDVTDTTYYGSPPSVYGHNVSQQYTTPFFRTPKMPKLDHGEAYGRPLGNRLFLSFDDLELTPDQCAELIRYYQQNPAARAELGRPDAVSRAQWTAAQSPSVVREIR